MKPLLVCDVDGVLANFTQGVLDFLRERYGLDYCSDDVDQWSFKEALGLTDEIWRACTEHICSDGFAFNLEPLPACRELSLILSQKDRPFDVVFCTSPWWTSKTWCYDRTNWLMDHFGQTQGRRVLQGSLKHYVVGERETFFVDDKPEAVTAWIEAYFTRDTSWMCQAYLWDSHSNKSATDFVRVSSFAELIGKADL